MKGSPNTGRAAGTKFIPAEGTYFKED